MVAIKSPQMEMLTEYFPILYSSGEEMILLEIDLSYLSLLITVATATVFGSACPFFPVLITCICEGFSLLQGSYRSWKSWKYHGILYSIMEIWNFLGKC